MKRRRLNDCPFCSSSNLEIKRKDKEEGPRYAVRCKDCGTHGPVFRDEQHSAIGWNTLPRLAPNAGANVSGRLGKCHDNS